MTVPMLAGSIATGRPATAPSHAAPTSDGSHTAIQPQTKDRRDRLHLDVRVGLVGGERLAALEAECARLVSCAINS